MALAFLLRLFEQRNLRFEIRGKALAWASLPRSREVRTLNSLDDALLVNSRHFNSPELHCSVALKDIAHQSEQPLSSHLTPFSE